MSRIKGASRILYRTWRDVLEFAFPTACAACGDTLDHAALLCDVCDARLHDLRRLPSCVKCAAPLPDPLGPCGRCHDRGIRPLSVVARLSTFESTTRDLIHTIKYGRRWAIVSPVAKLLHEQPRVERLLQNTDIIVPIPLHWTRRFTRGFNQAESLAQALAARSGVRVCRALSRVRRTPPQTTMSSRVQRLRNVAGAFALRRAHVLTGQRVVLVDDVMTTGATLRAAAKIIRRHAKPVSISAIVIATANPLKTGLSAV